MSGLCEDRAPVWAAVTLDGREGESPMALGDFGQLAALIESLPYDLKGVGVITAARIITAHDAALLGAVE